MPPRFAQIIDTSEATFNNVLATFPNKAKELAKQRQLYNELAQKNQGQLESFITAGKKPPLKYLAPPQMVLEPGVHYKQEWIKDKYNPGWNAQGIPNGKNVDFIKFAKVPMGDWDWNDAIHSSEAVTIDHLGDVYDRLVRFTHDNPSSKWQTYLTPGGVRAFEVAQNFTPKEFNDAGYFETLAIDPVYQRMAQSTVIPFDQHKYKGLYPRQGWNARISGKPGRPDDFVAFPLGTVGDALTNPYNQRLIDSYHDLPIMRSMVNDGMEPYKMPTSGLKLLEYHLSTVPRQYAAPIEQRLQTMGVIPN